MRQQIIANREGGTGIKFFRKVHFKPGCDGALWKIHFNYLIKMIFLSYSKVLVFSLYSKNISLAVLK
jgi:hypothetical protein